MATKRVFIAKKESEWEIIEARISELGRGGLAPFLRKGCMKLIERYKSCNDYVTPATGKRIKKQPFIPEEIYLKLQEISIETNKPIALIIDEFLITPLLLPRDFFVRQDSPFP